MVRNEVADRCGTCHDKVGASFKDSFHGKAAALKNQKAAVCADCHTPHHNLLASDPRSSIHPDRLAKTCGACHQNVNASFLSFDPHANPTDPKRNLYVYLVWIGMTTLLLGVFGFFGLHDLLWLQRAIVGRLRGEWSTQHQGGTYVRRFKSHQIWTHVSIVASFLLLAATGLPLKYAEASWAPRLMGLFGSPEIAGLLHRFAAVVTFGYFAWHLGTLAYGWLVKKERGYFWGPRSMVPQPRDLLDLWAMLKFFLYIGPRPQVRPLHLLGEVRLHGRLLGRGGDRHLGPGAVDAHLLHHLLAGLGAQRRLRGAQRRSPAGHRLHLPVPLLPHPPAARSLPARPVVFTGRMPLAAFKEERPLEYDRLVAEGKLEELLAPAPTVVEMRVAYVFGFTALAIGIVLAVFIFAPCWAA